MFPHKLLAFTWHDQFGCSFRIRMPLGTITQVRDDGGSQRSGKGYEMLHLSQWWKLRAFSSGLEVRYEGKRVGGGRAIPEWNENAPVQSGAEWEGKMLISGHDMWVFVGDRGNPSGNVEVTKKKNQKDGYSLRKKFRATRQKRILKGMEYRVLC